MLATPGPEPVAEPQELRLVDRREERHHRCLDDLVLDGGRPLFAVRLRYVPPTRGQCPIGAPMDARVQISEVSVKVCRVALPCHAVDTWSGALLQFEEHSPQDVDRDVVQERCELLLLVPGDSSTYADPRLLPSACHDGIGTPDCIAFAAQYLACTCPCQRFAYCLTAVSRA